MSLKLGLYRNKRKLCRSKFCENLPSHFHSENSLKKEMLHNLLEPQLSQALLERERTNIILNRRTMPRTDSKVTRLSQSLQIVTPSRDRRGSTLRKSQTRTYTQPETSTAKTWTIYRYQAHYEHHLSNSIRDPAVTKTVHRNHLVEYYTKEGSLPAMIEEYVPSNHQNDNFYERFMEQRTRDLNNPSSTEEHGSFPFPIEPLRSIPSISKPKRSSVQSNGSGITSNFASSRTPVLSPAIHTETSTPHSSSSQQAQPAQLSTREHLSPIQQIIRNSATRMARKTVNSRPKEPKYNRSQPKYPDSQSVLKTITRQGYKL